MDRIRFIPGQEAKAQIFDANGLIFFGREVALDFAEEYVMKVPGAVQSHQVNILFQTMSACMSAGDRVDIRFGLKSPDPKLGQEEYPSGELVGHTWATFKGADGREKVLWEVGRGTPAAGDAYATRAFNAYRQAVAGLLGESSPSPVPVDPNAALLPDEFNGNPVISRALAPSNLYEASGRMWYFVDLAPVDGVEAPVMLSRPMRSFDALILAALVALVNGRPPMVFGVRPTLGGLGKMPLGFVRTLYEDDRRVEPTDDTPFLVM